MQTSLSEICNDVEKSIDFAFNGKFVLKFYDYLKTKEVKRSEVEEFINSSTAENLSSLVLDLDEYLEGGSDNLHKQLREGYGHIPKPIARKIKEYLNGILKDAEKYHYDKRPGRRKKQSK